MINEVRLTKEPDTRLSGTMESLGVWSNPDGLWVDFGNRDYVPLGYKGEYLYQYDSGWYLEIVFEKHHVSDKYLVTKARLLSPSYYTMSFHNMDIPIVSYYVTNLDFVEKFLEKDCGGL